MKSFENTLLLPNFLGIGAPRSGTTWLHSLLESHPNVLMPVKRKELRFFTEHYERGLEWYSREFEYSSKYKSNHLEAIGEITPVYMYNEDCIDRIRDIDSIKKFIVCLRNPIDRLFSSYEEFSSRLNLDIEFNEFIQEFPEIVSFGYYARALRPWLQDFGKGRFLVLKFENMVSNVEITKRKIAQFLEISEDGFPLNAGGERVNYSFDPRYPHLNRAVIKGVNFLHDSNLSIIVHFGERIGLRKIYEHIMPRSSNRILTDAMRTEVWDIYKSDIELLTELTDFDYRSWIP